MRKESKFSNTSSSYITADEVKLIQAVLNRDQRAVSRFIDRYQDMVYSTVYSQLYQRNEADDIAQEAMVDIIHNLSRFQANSALSTWIYKICVNKALERNRYWSRKKRFAITVFTEDGPITTIQSISEGGTPETELLQSERHQKLYAAIDTLPESQRTALTLFQFEGLSYSEIGDVMELSKSAVESLIFRARTNLRNRLEDMINDA